VINKCGAICGMRIGRGNQSDRRRVNEMYLVIDFRNVCYFSQDNIKMKNNNIIN
jgi:hypothetical protein